MVRGTSMRAIDGSVNHKRTDSADGEEAWKLWQVWDNSSQLDSETLMKAQHMEQLPICLVVGTGGMNPDIILKGRSWRFPSLP